MNKFFLLLVFFLIFAVVLGVGKLDLRSIEPKASGPIVVNSKIAETPITLEVVNTPVTRTQGLSGRNILEEGKGMLFVFPKEGKYGFWMKDMSFPIDIIWISSDFGIIGVEKNVLPSSYPSSFYPPEDVLLVLETPGGFFEKNNLKIGDQLVIESQNKVFEGVF